MRSFTLFLLGGLPNWLYNSDIGDKVNLSPTFFVDKTRNWNPNIAESTFGAKNENCISLEAAAKCETDCETINLECLVACDGDSSCLSQCSREFLTCVDNCPCFTNCYEVNYGRNYGRFCSNSSLTDFPYFNRYNQTLIGKFSNKTMRLERNFTSNTPTQIILVQLRGLIQSNILFYHSDIKIYFILIVLIDISFILYIIFSRSARCKTEFLSDVSKFTILRMVTNVFVLKLILTEHIIVQ